MLDWLIEFYYIRFLQKGVEILLDRFGVKLNQKFYRVNYPKKKQPE